jgi:methylated-DNA-[protein]-cysteine S-methyltransferase
MPFSTLETKLGVIQISASNKGVCEVVFTDEVSNEVSETNPWIEKTIEQIYGFLEQKRTVFDIPLDIQGTPFQEEVWKKVHQVPFGSTISYLKIAQQLGDAKKVRAVASAIAKNPVLLLIPCHRVVGSDGRLIGYSGGIERKKQLLAHEGYPFQNSLFS